MKRVKSLTYFPEQKGQWGKYKVRNGEDVYTSDSFSECVDFFRFLERLGYYPTYPVYSDPLNYMR